MLMTLMLMMLVTKEFHKKQCEKTPQNKIALVVGLNYQDSTGNDRKGDREESHRTGLKSASDVADVLKDRCGYRLLRDRVQLELDGPSLARLVNEFVEELKKTPGSHGVFFFSGQTLQFQGRQFLLPREAMTLIADSDSFSQFTSVNDLKRFGALDVQFVIDEMEKTGSKLNVVLLDSQPQGPSSSSSADQCTGGLHVNKAGSVVLQAAGAGQRLFDTDGNVTSRSISLRQSLFVNQLIPELTSNKDVVLSLRQAARSVHRVSGGTQTPVLLSAPIDEDHSFRD